MTSFVAVILLIIAIALGGTWWFAQESAQQDYHYACVDNACSRVGGAGQSSCSSDLECAPVTVTTLITPTTLAMAETECVTQFKSAIAFSDVSLCKAKVTSCLTALAYCEASVADPDCIRWFQGESVPSDKEILCRNNLAFRNADASLCKELSGNTRIQCEAVHSHNAAYCNSITDVTQDRLLCKSLVSLFANDASSCDSEDGGQCAELVAYQESVKR